jgi:RNA polymerase sigma factor (sigma-70 family)
MSASVEVLGSPEWLAALKDSGPERELRIEELRRFLLVALRAGLAGNAAAGDAFIEDVAQDATLRILERIDSFQGRSRFTTWATTIAIRLAFTELRRARWRDVSLDQFLASGLDGATLLQSDSPETAARSDNPGHQGGFAAGNADGPHGPPTDRVGSRTRGHEPGSVGRKAGHQSQRALQAGARRPQEAARRPGA